MAATAEKRAFGQYSIDEKIAQGGMAEIFLGRASGPHGLERPVVIKRILPHIAASEEFVTMLVQEAKLAVQLSHGNIAQVFDLGKIEEDYFIVMEYVPGVTLSRIARLLRQKAEFMPVPIALFIVSEVANGLDYMHRKTDAQGNPLHIVHRDISPQNIMISDAGTIKIIDFGIAKAADHAVTTDSGVVKGKFAYMSPEHVEGEKVDHRTDIFSLGIILWELLTNQRLFKGKSNKETIERVKRCRVPSAGGYRDDIPPEVEAILQKALHSDRSKRYQDAHQFLLDLIRVLVQQYPNFAPLELEKFIRSLLGISIVDEVSPPESTAVPTSTKAITKEAQQEPEEPNEATAFANPAIFQERLKELEAYEVAKQEPPPEIENEIEEAEPEEPPPPRDPWWPKVVAAIQQLLPTRAVLLVVTRWTALSVAVVLLGYGGYRAVGPIKNWLSDITAPPRSVTPPEKTTQQPRQPLPPPPPKLATITIASQPAGAEIFINDRNTGRKTPATLESITPNKKYRLGLYLNPYQYWEKSFTPRPEQRIQLSAQLSLNHGSLQINSVPTGATVLLNNRQRGITPFTLEKLQPESLHQVKIIRPGFQVWSGEAKIFPGKTSTIKAVLKRVEVE